jgi:diguanylate cyclase (GGDEF)-like protein/PAS domain S-box-containing protein
MDCARLRLSRRLASVAAVTLAGLSTSFAVNLGHRWAQDEREAARQVLEVEAVAASQTVSLSMLMEGTRSAAQFDADGAAARSDATTALVALERVDAGAAADIGRRWRAIDNGVQSAASRHLQGDLPAAAGDATALDDAQSAMAARIDEVQARLLGESDRTDLVVALVTGLLIVGSLLLVVAVVLRSANRRQRLAVAESESAALRRSEESLRLLFDGSPQPVIVFAQDDLRLLAANRTALEFYGYTEAELLRLTLFDLNAPADHEDMLRAARDVRTVSHGRRVQHLRKDGAPVHVEVHSRPLTYQGVPARMSLIVDVTERVTLERELQHQALHDSLTALPNRALFLDRLAHLLSRRDAASAVLLLDLDGFKNVNDSLGHNAGDELLVAVAGRVAAAVRPGDTVARLGGDEFAVILEALADPAGIHTVCTRVLAALGEPFAVAGRSVAVAASIGVTLCAGPARSAEAVLGEADIAMYAAKVGGKGGYQVFSGAMQAGVLDRIALEQDLRHAVAAGQLRVLYQPKVDARTGRVGAAEALVRWQHPVRGVVPPDAFIGLAEEIGVITEIDGWVLDSACAQVAAWDAAGLRLDHVAVNVSGRELAGGGLLERVDGALRRHGLVGSRLEIELTEGSAVQQPEEALAEVARIRRLGVTIAIDDFGTGYSVLSRLQHFPLDRLKIDKTFVSTIDADGSAPLVAAMIGMGHELGLEVVAEGVETAAQLRFLRSHGCDQLQGYLLSRPVEAAAMAELVGTVMSVATQGGDAVPADLVPATPQRRRLVQVLLAELERLTGMESTYVTRIDMARRVQIPVEVHNVGEMTIPVGMVVPLDETLCQRVMDDGRCYVASVSSQYPDVAAARELGIETFVSVPVHDDEGALMGTLCAASRHRVDLPDSVVGVMTQFAGLISRASALDAVAA